MEDEPPAKAAKLEFLAARRRLKAQDADPSPGDGLALDAHL